MNLTNSEGVERLVAQREDLMAVGEEAVFACLPVLPLIGSALTGYEVSKRIDPHVIATPEEWADAAHAIATLHKLIERFK